MTKPYRNSFAWKPGEREAFASTVWDEADLAPGGYLDVLRDGGHFPRTPHTKWTAKIWATATTDWECKLKLVHAPEAIAFAELDKFHRELSRFAMTYLREAVARFELRALPWVLVEARTHAKEALAALGPFGVPELAPCVASVLHTKKYRAPAEAWLERHPKAARVGLAADVASGKAKQKQAALVAMAYLDDL